MKRSLSFIVVGLSVFCTEARIQQINPELLVAAAQGDVNSVQELLDQGVPVDVKNEDGMTALILAAELGQSAVVRTLLENKANPNIAIIGEPSSCTEEESPDSPVVCASILPGQQPPFMKHEQWTALHFAVDNGKKKSALLLLKKGRALVDSKDAQGKTPLMLAAKKGDFSVLTMLIRYKADVNAKSSANRSALYYAVAYADRTGENGLSVIKELRNSGAEVTDEILATAELREKHKEIVKILTGAPSKSIYERVVLR